MAQPIIIVTGKEQKKERTGGFYTLFGWALVIIFFALSFFASWFFNIIINSIPYMNILIFLLSLIGTFYGFVARKTWIGIIGWIILCLFLVATVLIPLIFNMLFGGLGSLFGLGVLQGLFGGGELFGLGGLF